MIRLDLSDDPRWLDLGRGVRVQVRPLTSPVYNLIQARALELMGQLEDDGELALDLASRTIREALYRSLITKGLALYAILAWDGLGDADGLAAVTPASVEAFVDGQPVLAQVFHHAYLEPFALLDAEKNVCTPAPAGIGAAGEPIAGDATTADCPAPAVAVAGTASAALRSNTPP
jgi:hypothetical protein